MEDFIPKSPILYNYSYEEQTEINDMLLYETRQQDPVLRQLLLWKRYKIFPLPFTNNTSEQKITALL